jgi:hypothetical protein
MTAGGIESRVDDELDPEIAQYAREKSQHRVGVAALRRLRSMVDRGQRDEAEIRQFTVHALLWLAFVAFSVPLAMFCIGGLRVLYEFLAQGRPLAGYFARLIFELGTIWLFVIPWAAALWALVRFRRSLNHQAAH